MIMRLWFFLLGVNRPGLNVEQEQFGRRAARAFEARLLTGGLPAHLPEPQVKLWIFALRLDHAKTRRGQRDQQRGAGRARRNIETLSRSANQPRDANLLVFKLGLLVIFARRPGFAVE